MSHAGRLTLAFVLVSAACHGRRPLPVVAPAHAAAEAPRAPAQARAAYLRARWHLERGELDAAAAALDRAALFDPDSEAIARSRAELTRRRRSAQPE